MTEAEFEIFMDSLRVPGSVHISPKRVIAALGIRAKDLNAISNPQERMAAKNQHGSAGLQIALRNLVRILSAARGNHENAEQMLYWFMNYPLAQFYYRTPFEMYADARIEELLSLLSVSAQRHPVDEVPHRRNR
ncbi:hypothetical protein [Lysobacter sp. Hz 25]|uniref:hypothetical protein n=1 Tax=Lysobacter sp. Hz 25 TaxID=3383698 RepID=UPI0038D3A302